MWRVRCRAYSTVTDASGYTGYTERSSIGPDGEEVRATLFNPNKHERCFGCWVVLSRWRLQIRWWEKAPGWLQDTAKEVRALSLHGLRLAHRLWVDPSTKDTSISTQKDDAFG